jgi:hypothetical protein
MDILRVKKAHLPAVVPPVGRKKKERKVISAAAITESDSQRDVTAEAGPSTGPGTVGDPATATISNDEESDEVESSDEE